MRVRIEGADGAPGTVIDALIGAVAEAIRAAGGLATGGVYLRSRTPGVLRLAVLSGMPAELMRPWWRMPQYRPVPVADAYRLGLPVVLNDGTDMMRRYPQVSASLPFHFGVVFVPVRGGGTTYGVLGVMRPAQPNVTEPLPDRRLTTMADRLGDVLHAVDVGGDPVVWDGPPLCVRPPATGCAQGRVGHFLWDPAERTVTADTTFWGLTGGCEKDIAQSPEVLARAVSPDDGPVVSSALREAARGSPARPLWVRAGDGGHRLLEFWTEGPAREGYRVGGLVVDPGPGPAAESADLLPDGVFAFERTGLITYVNPRAADLLGRPRTELVGRPLLKVLPWLDRRGYEDQLRAALLSAEPVRFQVEHSKLGPHGERESDWLTLLVYPGPDVVTCQVVPLGHTADAVSVDETAVTTGTRDAKEALSSAYRPIVLGIALSGALTAHQVSEVVMRELLPAFECRRLAIYLLHERRLHLAWETGFPPGSLDQFEGVGLDAKLPSVETLTTGHPLFFESMEQMRAAYQGIPSDAQTGARAFLPLIASGRPVGSCILGFEHARTFSSEERTVLTALAGLIAQALERARQYDTEAALARGLQEALLPHRLSEHPLMETAVLYLPGTQGLDVGGDWYDVVEAGDGLALVIGDVQGHGVQAAATMGQLRSAIRAFALGDHPPDQVMSSTNRLLIDLDPGQFASCCYVRLDPVTGAARAARAGHPQPLLSHPDGHTTVLDLPGGVVLGVDPGAGYPVTRLRLEPGAVLALYTDGLVERPGADLGEGVEALRAALSDAREAPGRVGGLRLTEVADRITDRVLHTADRTDDMTLLLAMRRDEGDGASRSGAAARAGRAVAGEASEIRGAC
ncbi:SpoIIE family protein phosphatase [Streptomyces sp. NPDC050743]|uniref:SpoIIE family protein phosphatase n=1 Tax=Streptomyces sp. NPDC050743 TaxID=3365634 RepID=UPI003799FA9B